MTRSDPGLLQVMLMDDGGDVWLMCNAVMWHCMSDTKPPRTTQELEAANERIVYFEECPRAHVQAVISRGQDHGSMAPAGDGSVPHR